MVRQANVRILSNRTKQFAKVTYDVCPSGCLNARSGPLLIQYSSSTSKRGSVSMLVPHQYPGCDVIEAMTYSSSCIAHGRPVLKL